MAMPTLVDILRDRIKELEAELKDFRDTGLTPEEIQNDVRIHREMWEEKYNELKADRDYWKAEAIKATAELGEMKIAEVMKGGDVQ